MAQGRVVGVSKVSVARVVPRTPILYEPPGLGRLRKVALIGTAGTMELAPFDDPSWEIWAHSSAAPALPRADRFFDLHGRKVWRRPKAWHRDYQRWLRELPVPIYMQRHYDEVPQSVPYPKGRVLAEFRRYFTSQAAWMIALALTEGITHLGFFGIHYEASSERDWQKPGCEYWMGFAEGRGVQLVIPNACPLLKHPRLYGWESHDADGKNLMIPPKHDGFDPSQLTMIDMESSAPRPPLAPLPEGVAVNWEHSGHRFRH